MSDFLFVLGEAIITYCEFGCRSRNDAKDRNGKASEKK